MKPGFDYIGVAVAFCCHDGKGNFLFGKRGPRARDEQGAWEFGGGGVEFGETTQEAVLREISEEYGCQAEVSEALPTFSLLRNINGTPSHWLMVPFVVQVKADEVKLNPEEAVEEFGWFSLSQPPAPLHTGAKQMLEMYSGFLEKYQ